MSHFELLFLDNHLLVINKPAGMLIQGDSTGDITLFDEAKLFLKKRFNKPGNVFLGLVHRLDRPVSGTVVFARTSKAASRLSEQFRKKTIRKTYRALVKGKMPESGRLEDRIIRDGPTSKIVTGDAGKPAVLTYKRLLVKQGLSLVEINIETGRHHQIRVQLANLGFPILGDFRYGSKEEFPNKSIALHAYSLSFLHPVEQKQLVFTSAPLIQWPFFRTPAD